ncbi:MAG: thioredoxin family protein [Propionicimonas sp.]
MTGVWIVLAVVVLVLAFGGYRRLTDGRVRAVTRPEVPRLDAAQLGSELGSQATFVQFSSAVCAPCRSTHRLLTDLVAEEPAIAHIDLDAETRLDLVERFGVARTPTVLVLDAAGVVRHRIVGAPRKADLRAALAALAPSGTAA